MIWLVVLADCDAILRVCTSEEVANAWADHYAKQRGTESAVVSGAYQLTTESPR